MKLCVWESSASNFGDELNKWLFPRLLPGFFDNDEGVIFLGIGSMLERNQFLSHNYPPSAIKIVLGTGYGGYSSGQLPDMDHTWKVYFVRGPRTAAMLGIEAKLGIGDAGSLVGTVPETKLMPRGIAGPALMPHFDSALNGPWQQLAALVGVRYIDPRWPVDRVLPAIASSSILITEAMHGAIVADSLRVPWVPFSPLGHHHFKWYDWTESLGINLLFAPRAPSTLLEALSGSFKGRPRIAERIFFHGRKFDLSSLNSLFVKSAVRSLERALEASPHMSSDTALSKASDSMLEQLALVQRQFANRDSTALMPGR